MNDVNYIVICKTGRSERRPEDERYVLATREIFRSKAEAYEYAKGVAKSRQPIVVSGRFNQLRWNGLTPEQIERMKEATLKFYSE